MKTTKITAEKGVAIAYILWFFLGSFGAHRLYLGLKVSGLIQLSVGLIMWVLLAVGWIILGSEVASSDSDIFSILSALGSSFIVWTIASPFALVAFVWWVVDVFLTHGYVSDYNRKVTKP